MNGALYHLKITTDDITTSDGAHLTITGLRKQAAPEWRVLGLEHERAVLRRVLR